MIARSDLVARFDGDGERHALVVAPAGYGKTTLMLNLGQHVGSFAYLRVTQTHADPAVLMQDLAVALGSIGLVSEDAVHRISSRSLEPGLQAATRLAEAIALIEGPALLLLDDIHVLRDQRAGDALTVLIELLPPGVRMVAAGHDAPCLPVARLRAAHRLLQLGTSDLAFGTDDVVELAGLLGAEISREDAVGLVSATEGWPVAVSLALHSLAEAGTRRATPLDRALTRSVAEYVHEELLASLDPDQRAWLLQSSVLEEMSGPLCDAALDTSGSLALLRDLERSRLLVDAVDPQATRYRYHPLLRRVLLDELEVAMPGRSRVVNARAARWFDTQGQALEALACADGAQDRDLLANLMASHVWGLHWSGRIATLERWAATFDQDGVRERYPAVAIVLGFIYSIDGRRHEAELWLAAAEASPSEGPMPDGSSRDAWVAMLRGMMVPGGVGSMAADAQLAATGIRGDSPWVPGARLLSAVAALLQGRLDGAADRAREAVEVAETRGALPGFAMSIGIESALALRSGDGNRARELVHHGLERIKAAGMADYVLCCLLHAVAARVAIASGSSSDARHHLAHVHRLRPLMTASVPWLSTMVRREAIEALIATGDIGSARTLLREIDDILRIRPDLGLLATDAEEIRGRLGAIEDSSSGHWTLTEAELRVLQYLPTHLTFGEIAERLYVSPHTVKSQAVAIYGKLGVSSRRAAIETAVEQGLLDASALRFPLGPGISSGIG